MRAMVAMFAMFATCHAPVFRGDHGRRGPPRPSRPASSAPPVLRGAHAPHVAHVAHERHTGVSCVAWAPAMNSGRSDDASGQPDDRHRSHVSSRNVPQGHRAAGRGGGRPSGPMARVVGRARDVAVHREGTDLPESHELHPPTVGDPGVGRVRQRPRPAVGAASRSERTAKPSTRGISTGRDTGSGRASSDRIPSGPSPSGASAVPGSGSTSFVPHRPRPAIDRRR
jgi:hypothetical protein